MDTIQNATAFRKAIGSESDSEKLVRDVRVVLQDADELIKATAGDVEERTREARAKLAGALVVTRETCNQFEQGLTLRLHAAKTTIRERPFEMIGVAFGIGMALGIVLDRVLGGSD